MASRELHVDIALSDVVKLHLILGRVRGLRVYCDSNSRLRVL